MKNWHFNMDITTFKGRLIKKGGTTSDPAKHFAELQKRFYPSARIIDWVPMSEDHKREIGPHRIVEFNEDATVKHRIPDNDHAHVGGLEDNHELEGVDYTAPGTSRAGLSVHDQRDLGAHPTMVQHEDDHDEDAPDITAPVRIDGEIPTPVTKSTPSASEVANRLRAPTLGNPVLLQSKTPPPAPLPQPKPNKPENAA